MNFKILAKLSNRGIALPMVLGLVMCLGIWIGSLSYTMSQSRNRFQQLVKIRRSYFLARSALQHFFLKVKTYQRLYPQAMNTLYKASKSDWDVLARAFVGDIILPPESINWEFSGKYGISSFTIESMDNDTAMMAIRITANGDVDGLKETICRVYKVSR